MLAFALAAVTAFAVTATACDVFGDDRGSGRQARLRLWTLRDDRINPVLKSAIERYNAASRHRVEMTVYEPEAYSQKLQETMGSADAPDIFVNWGGEALAQYVGLGQVLDLSLTMGGRTAFRDAFLPAVLGAGTINGKPYGLPMSGVQPVLLFYNKDVFAAASAAPPKTYDELLTLVDTFKARKITPIALAGARPWSTLQYPMYLLDRVGGQQKFADVVAGKPGAWRDAAVLKALTMCQELARRGAFGDTFLSVGYDSGDPTKGSGDPTKGSGDPAKGSGNPAKGSGDPAGGGDDGGGPGLGADVGGDPSGVVVTETAGRLLATGRAAMHLMGAWEYARQQGTNPDFARSGLGWTVFPTVSGGAGDPANVAGPPGNFFSITSASRNRDAAADFLSRTLTSDAYVRGLIGAGEVPAVKGADGKLAGTANAEFATFVFRTVAAAPAVTPAWDQALTPETSAVVAGNLQKLLLRQITPDELVAAIDKPR